MVSQVIPVPQSPSAPAGPVAYAAALLLTALSTAVGLAIASAWGTGPVVLLYLPAVLGAAIYCGLWPSLVGAVASALAFNFFFTRPYRTFIIHSPVDIMTVAMLFLVAVVTSRLASSLREQERLARRHAARNATIAGFARALLSCPGESDIARLAIDELSRLFDCKVTLVAGADDPQDLAQALPPEELAPSDCAAAALTLRTGELAGRGTGRVPMAEWQFHPVASDRAVMAAAGFARADGTRPIDRDQEVLLGSLLDQVALALERARLEREGREMETLRERDKLRSALLSSIGDDIKPRLAGITASARAIRRTGGADRTQLSGIFSEVNRLDRYVDNLVDLAPGADQEPIVIGPLQIDLHRRSVRRDSVEVHLTPKEFALLTELAKQAGRVLTHAQLLRAVWGPAQQNQIEYLRVAIASLRRKLEVDASHPQLITNEPAVGYRLATGS